MGWMPIWFHYFIPASNEPKSCLHDLGDCREGAIPRSLLRIQAMMPRSLLRGISLDGGRAAVPCAGGTRLARTGAGA